MINSTIRLEDVAELTVGFVGNMTKEYTNEGICFFRSLNINPFHIDTSDLLHISPNFNDKIKKSELHEGDLVIVRTGRPGACCVIPKEYEGSNCSDLVIIRPDKEKIDPYYLEAYINFMTQKQINNNQVGAIQKHFNIGSAKDMILFLPKLRTQKEIGSIVCLLNSKISINNKINAELEAMAKIIYDYWFLQFEFPNEEEKPYKSSGGKMVWNDELGQEIPDGWEVFTLGDIIVENNKSPVQVTDAKDATGDIPFFTSGDSILEWDGKMVDGGNCFLNTGGNADLKFYIGPAAYSTDTWCIKGKDNLTNYLYLTLLTIKPELDIKFFQGTGLKHLQKPLLKNREIYIPSDKKLNEFNGFVQPILDKISENLRENRQLEQLRDFLLPLLMNGQVGFKDE